MYVRRDRTLILYLRYLRAGVRTLEIVAEITGFVGGVKRYRSGRSLNSSGVRFVSMFPLTRRK